MTFVSILSRPSVRAVAVSLVAILTVVGTAKALTTVSSTLIETDGDLTVDGGVSLGNGEDADVIDIGGGEDTIGIGGDTTFSEPVQFDDDVTLGILFGSTTTVNGKIVAGSDDLLTLGDALVGPTIVIDTDTDFTSVTGEIDFQDIAIFNADATFGDDDADFIESQGFFFVSSDQGLEVSNGPALLDVSLSVGNGDEMSQANHNRLTNVTSSSIAADSCGTYATVTAFGSVTTSAEMVVIATPDSDSSANGIEDNNLTWNAYVSGNSAVTIRACNPTAAPIDTDDDQEWDLASFIY